MPVIRLYFKPIFTIMLKKCALLAFAAIPAFVFSSCSSSEESATSAAKNVVEDLTDLVKENKSASIIDMVAALHEYVEEETPDLVAEFKDLSDAERASVIVNVLKSDEGKKLIAELETLSANESVAKVVGEAMSNGTENLAEFPMETKMQIIEIGANVLKVGVSLGIDKAAVQKAVGKAMD